MSRGLSAVTLIGALCSLLFLPCMLAAAGQVLPDELTVPLGEVKGVGTNVTLVLAKRSMRSDNYLCGIWTDDGFKPVTFPVSTYRGYVQGDPAVRVTANIEPGGILNANLSAGIADIAQIRGRKIDVGEGKSTPTMSAGNKVVPLLSLKQRTLPTPSGCLVPPVPMRLSRWIITIPGSYTSQYDLEKVVSRVEQRWNDGDYVFARDVGTAWEIDVMVLVDPKSTKGVDLAAVLGGSTDRIKNHLHATVTGVPGRNNGKGNSLCVTGDGVEASILLHEGAHLYGNWCHQMDSGDGLFGGGACFGRNNVQILTRVTMDPNAYCHRGEDAYPGVVYGGILPPSAMRDMANTFKDKPVAIAVLENDYDGNGDGISLQAVTPTSEKGGTVVVHADGKRAVYTPKPGFVGLDSFTYTVVDSTGAANKSGFVKVDVRTDGLAVHIDFEDAEKDGIEWMRKAGDWRLWSYDTMDNRPEAQKLTYHFRNRGPYDGGRATAHWINYAPVPGVRGMGLLNPVVGGDGKAQVDLTSGGDPGCESLSASVWVLYPQAVRAGMILCKSPCGYKTLTSGWAVRCTGSAFSFFGSGVRLSLGGGENFEIHSEDPIQPDTWYHLVMVMDRGAAKLRAYVNNKEVTASSTSPNIPAGVIEYHAPLRLFNGPGWKSWGAAPMLVDEVKILTAALTPQQVAALYAEGKDAMVPDLKGK